MPELGEGWADVRFDGRIFGARRAVQLRRIEDRRVAQGTEEEPVVQLPAAGKPLGAELDFIDGAGTGPGNRRLDVVVYMLLRAAANYVHHLICRIGRIDDHGAAVIAVEPPIGRRCADRVVLEGAIADQLFDGHFHRHIVQLD